MTGYKFFTSLQLVVCKYTHFIAPFQALEMIPSTTMTWWNETYVWKRELEGNVYSRRMGCLGMIQSATEHQEVVNLYGS